MRHFLIIIAILFISTKIQSQNIKIVKISNPSTFPIIPWVEDNNSNIKKGKPLFQIKAEHSELTAKGWVATTNNDILLNIEVKDDIHYNLQDGGDIWNGDGIQIGIDCHGDGSGVLPTKEAKGTNGEDDGALGFALTKNGPEAFAWFTGFKATNQQMPSELVEIFRDEKKKITHYEIKIPWSRFETKPGSFPFLGIAVQINDNDPDPKGQNNLYWGKGADGAPRPGLFEKVIIGNPPQGIATLVGLNNQIWKLGDKAEFFASIASTKDRWITAIAGTDTLIKRLPGNKDLNINRFSIKFTPKVSTGNEKMEVFISDETKTKKLLTENMEMIVPEEITRQFMQKLNRLISDSSNHPLFTRHLKSIKALCEGEWAKVNVYGEFNPRLRAETFKFISNIAQGFEGDAAKWESYLSGNRVLYMAYISKRDNTLQHYSLTLPKNWDIEKSYPLFVELHGAGNPAVLSGPSAQLGKESTQLDLFGYSNPKSYAQIERNGYHIMPHGRGNSRYKDIGEIDVWEAFNDVSSSFKIDENRRYLYGFSMGGGGTWSIGLRTPDIWAAIAVYAGGLWNEKLGHNLGKNATNLPIWIWCGEKDHLFREVKHMKSELLQFNINPIVTTVPGVHHEYTSKAQEDGVKWMQQFVRKRPDNFSFMADTDNHLGIWGITMNRDEKVSCLPHFSCSIKGNKVIIESEGTKGLEVRLGQDGLNLAGNVEVIWNGDKAYEGPVKSIALGETLVDKWNH